MGLCRIRIAQRVLEASLYNYINCNIKKSQQTENEGPKGDCDMCEIFGCSSSVSIKINDYLKEFYSHSNEHPHGWGLACMSEEDVQIEKEPVQATESHYLKERMTVPIYVKNGFAHIRYATIGNVYYKNCHPYTGKDRSGRRWTMVHNGTIFEYAPLHSYINVQQGDTDSERILLYIIDQMNENMILRKRELNEKERFQLLDSIVQEMAKGNKLNFMIYDGEIMYVHTNLANSLYRLEKEEQAFFSTRPLTEENWQPVPFTTLLAYRDGRQLFQGTNHGNEYIESEENLKFLYQIFSNL